MPKSYPYLFLFLLFLLVGCQDKKPDRPDPATNYLTAIPDPKTLGEMYVSDPNSLLQPGTADVLNARLDSLDSSGRAHIDVVLVPSIGEEVPKTAATALFNQWKIGDKTKNNGLLMLLVMDQHRIEFETGYGLEADLPDIICYRIQQDYMVPQMRAGRTDAAVLAGVGALIRKLGGAAPAPALLPPGQRLDTLTDGRDAPVVKSISEPEESEPVLAPSQGYEVEVNRAARASELAEQAEQANSFWNRWNGPLVLVAGMGILAGLALLTSQGEKRALRLKKLGIISVFIVVISLSVQSILLLLYLVPLLAMHAYFLWQYTLTRQPAWQALSRHEQYLALVKTHHYLGFTAWVFPLGLYWYWPWHRRRLAPLRDAPYTCPTCGQPMSRLDSTAEKPYLEAGQQAEESMKSVDYDVWQCPNGHQLQLPYTNLDTSVQECPACHYQTLLTTTQTVQAANTSHGGWGWKIRRCKSCQHEQKEKYTIDRIVPRSSSSGGSSSSSSSSSRSSSSSSSSRSSSSGGSSGGGGSGSSW